MGRIRKAVRFTFSIGGYDGLSPIRKESSAESIGRETNRLLARYAAPAQASPGFPAGPARVIEQRLLCPECGYRGMHTSRCSAVNVPGGNPPGTS
jgi:hypothetical protein